MVNKVILVGRLGQDPELRYAQSGLPIANFNIATDESYNDREGNRVEKTEWHRVVVFQRQAETCANYLVKGSLVYIEGSLQTRKWQAQDGSDRYTTEVKAQRVNFLDRRGAREDGQQNYGGSYDQQSSAPQQNQQQRQQPQQQQQQNQQNQQPDDLGPAFPSEASGMDDVPF